MPKIHILDKHVAQQIAAGEVVERPASVAKELLENAIDAGATHITIEIERGGIGRLRITDDGCGISRADVSNAFLPHATSKIRLESDLEAIGTLGFRGEALASVAAVAKVEMLTRTQDEEVGTRYVIEGGEEVLLEDAGCPVGTTLIVRALFFNTPARMKFLKKDVSEANAIAGVVDRIALSHPEICLCFLREGKQTLATSGNGDLKSCAYSVFGKAFADQLIPVQYTLEGVSVHGYVSKPAGARPNRNMQFFFLNGRLVKTATASAALSEAYKNTTMVGKFPSCILHISLPPELVDVNVHPAKIEVRFAQEKPIFQTVYYGAKQALSQGDTRQEMHLDRPQAMPSTALSGQATPAARQRPLPAKQPDFWKQVSTEEFLGGTKQTEEPIVTMPPQREYPLHVASVAEVPTIQTEPSTLPAAVPVAVPKETGCIENLEKQPLPVHVVGEVFETYILAQQGEEILWIDKHAAHERMIYETLRSRQSERSAQVLLSPAVVSLSKEEYNAVLEQKNLFQEAGFEVDDFGDGMVVVRACPMELDTADLTQIIAELAGYLLEHRQELLPEKLDWIYHSVACRSAVKAGDFTAPREREVFVERLLSLPDIRYCPHGRPVMFVLTRKELEKQFGRIQ